MKPPTAACAWSTPSASRVAVRPLETVASTARPSAAPTWQVVLTSPEASPASSGRTPDIDSIIRAGKLIPTPAPMNSAEGITSTR